MKEISENIFNSGIIPEINEENFNKLDCLEKLNITAVILANENLASDVQAKYPNLVLGLTKVKDVSNINENIKFIITKHFNLDLIKEAMTKDLLVIPTINSINEIEEAKKIGLNLLNYAGTDFKKVDELNDTNFILSSKADIRKVFASSNTYACLVDYQDDFEGQLKEAVNTMHNFQITHVGINMENPESAKAQADEFSNMFGLTTSETPIAFFSGSMFELMKNPFLGKNGHISVGVNNILRAISYFNNMGYTFSNYMYKPDGSILLCYFDKEFSGFAVHLR